ncbi:putative tail fiber assembly protein [Vibrio phage 424E50-1]|nr:putative tail fiber assembly protein [Vibrio phage 424E50-1]
MSKKVHYYDPETKEYTRSEILTITAGYSEPLIPQCSLVVDLPNYDKETHKLKANTLNKSWEIVKRYVEVTAFHKLTRVAQTFEDESLVPEDFTLLVPTSSFDIFSEDGWVTDSLARLAQQEHDWVIAQLQWYDSKILYANRGDLVRSGGYTKSQLDTYAIALCDYTSTKEDGRIIINLDVRPSI